MAKWRGSRMLIDRRSSLFDVLDKISCTEKPDYLGLDGIRLKCKFSHNYNVHVMWSSDVNFLAIHFFAESLVWTILRFVQCSDNIPTAARDQPVAKHMEAPLATKCQFVLLFDISLIEHHDLHWVARLIIYGTLNQTCAKADYTTLVGICLSVYFIFVWLLQHLSDRNVEQLYAKRSSGSLGWWNCEEDRASCAFVVDELDGWVTFSQSGRVENKCPVGELRGVKSSFEVSPAATDLNGKLSWMFGKRPKGECVQRFCTDESWISKNVCFCDNRLLVYFTSTR